MKDVEVGLISELMQNSRRSDRELAKTFGVSQPTVTRLRSKLEKEGIIREYTMIPDFKRLGYQIMAFTFFAMQEPEKEEEKADLRRAALQMERKTPLANLIVANGIGLKKGRVAINLFRDYSDYVEGLKVIKNLPHIDSDRIDSFLVDLNDNNFRMLTMKEIAHNFQAFGKAQKEEWTTHAPK